VKTPIWLDRAIVGAVQERLIERFGGSHGIRDDGLLDSALGRPMNLLAYGKPSHFELAASYAFAIVRNHPFVDGNKRIGFMCAALFLEQNGYRFNAEEADVIVQTLALAAREVDESAYAEWLRKNSTKLKK
jgi:death on curing protein